MREYVDELVKMVKAHKSGASAKAFAAWETRAGKALPEDVKALYRVLDGGDFPGEVRLLTFAELSAQVPESFVVLGTRASRPETVLLMLTRADFEGHAESRPSWLSSLAEDDWMFALRKGEGADLKPARTFMGLLERVIPPRETETFGEVTFARGFSAVVALRNPKKKKPAPKAKPKAKVKAKKPVAKPKPAPKKAKKVVAKKPKPKAKKKR